jgi:putative glycosyltransferase (TIGR04372 family)
MRRMSIPSISVVIPCHNDGRYLPLLVRQLRAQSLAPAQIIIVDDASTDRSAEIIDALRRTHPEVQLLRNESNIGVINSINRGVAAASGQFIYMTGCDDLPLPGLFEKSAEILAAHPQTSVCFSNPCSWNADTWQVIESVPDLSGCAQYFTPHQLAEGLSALPFVQPHSGLIRKSAFEKSGGYDPDLGPSADWFFWMTTIFREGACHLPEPLSLWRVRRNSYLSTALRELSRKEEIVVALVNRLLSDQFADVYPRFIECNALSNYGAAAVSALRASEQLSARALALLNWTHGHRATADYAVRLIQWELAADVQTLLIPTPTRKESLPDKPNSEQQQPLSPHVPDPETLSGVRSILHRFGFYNKLRHLKWLLLRGRFAPLPRQTPDPVEPRDVTARRHAIAAARALDGQGNLGSAIDVLRQARLAHSLDDSELLAYLGTLEFRNSEYHRAVDTLERVAGNFLRCPDLFLVFYCAHICAGTRTRASILLKSLAEDRNAPAEICALRAFDLDLDGSADEAAQLYADIADRAETALSILDALTVHLFRSHGQHDICWRAWISLFKVLQMDRVTEGPELLDTPWPSAIGHFAVLDGFLKACTLGILPAKQRMLIARPGIYPASGEPHIANAAALHCFDDLIHVVRDGQEIAKIDKRPHFKQPLNVVLRSDRILDSWPRIATRAQRMWEEQKRPPLVQISAEHDARGFKVLTEMGIPPDAWFVTLHVRGSVKDWIDRSTHSRNAPIEDYLPALEEIVRRGGYVLRMGDASMPRLPSMEGVLDYAKGEYKADWMDVYLASRARFHLGTNSGMSVFPGVFGTPCAYTNWSPWGSYSWYGNALYAPKLIRRRDGKLLRFEEMVADPFSTCESEYFFQTHAYTLVNNSPDDIRLLVIDMFDLLAGKSNLSDSEQRLQDNLDRLLASKTGYGRCRLAPFFLRRNADLLEERRD